jgi:uncharacterized damage-inducible protein DinB
MDLIGHFQMLARYNRIANETLFEKCAQLDEPEYRKPRQGSFGSIHRLLNHVLLADRIWMARFEGRGQTTPPLNTVLFDELPGLSSARADEDARIEAFFGQLDESFLSRPLHYFNSLGREYFDSACVAVSHCFNHQTHHRGQVHVMLSQTPVSPPSLDLHRIINP